MSTIGHHWNFKAGPDSGSVLQTVLKLEVFICDFHQHDAVSDLSPVARQIVGSTQNFNIPPETNNIYFETSVRFLT